MEKRQRSRNLQEPTASREEFIIKSLITFVVIVILSVILNNILFWVHGRDENINFFSAVVVTIAFLISLSILCVGLLILSFPLIKITRRRLRDLGWTEFLVFVFPIFPLFLIVEVVIRDVDLIRLLDIIKGVDTFGGVLLFYILQDGGFWSSVMIALCLAVLPRQSEDTKVNNNRFFAVLSNAFATQGSGIAKKQYRIIFLSILLFNIVIRFGFQFTALSDEMVKGVYSTFIMIVNFASVFIMMIATYKRMKGVSNRPYLGIFPALFFPSLWSVIIGLPFNIIKNPFFLKSCIEHPWVFLPKYVLGFAVLAFFVWLFFARDMEKNIYSSQATETV